MGNGEAKVLQEAEAAATKETKPNSNHRQGENWRGRLQMNSKY